jgi:small subunit ribosomal protein S10|tara:strand:- start:30 stop:485 length:456 start_codon:yes stop_codon:yes gene_type:complete
MRGHEREIPRFPHWLSTRVFWTALFRAQLRETLTPFPVSSLFVARHQAAVAAQKIRIRLKSFEVKHMAAACDKIIEAAKATEASISGPVPLPTKRRIYCVLRSPHVNKDSREHFETRTHHRLIDVHQPTAQTIDALMGLELPAGVEIEVKL